MSHPNFGLEAIGTYGYQPRQSVISDTLTNAALNGTTTTRPSGLTEVCIVSDCTAIAGGASVEILIEGSNNTTDWHIIYQANIDERITATGQTVLNPSLASVIDIQRWGSIRVRAVETSGGGTFTIGVVASGIIRDSSDVAVRTTSLVRSADPETGAAVARVGATRYYTVQVVSANVVLGGASSVNCLLQGTNDGGTTWVNIADALVFTGNASQQMVQNGNALIDMGGFDTFRFQGVDVGGAATSYTFRCLSCQDPGDWLLGASGSASDSVDFLGNAVMYANNTAIDAEAGNNIDTSWQLQRLDGLPITSAVTLQFAVCDTAGAGAVDLATSTVFGASVTGTDVFGVAGTRLVVTTNATGFCEIRCTNAGAQANFVVCLGVEGLPIPGSSGFILYRSDEAPITFS